MRTYPGSLAIPRLLPLAFGLLASPALAQNTNGNGQQVAGTRPPAAIPAPGQPWEQRAPYGKGQKPAVAGQTRAGAVFTKTPYEEKVVASGLKHPWSLAFLPDGRMLVTEKPGTLRIVTQSGLVSDTLKGLPPALPTSRRKATRACSMWS